MKQTLNYAPEIERIVIGSIILKPELLLKYPIVEDLFYQSNLKLLLKTIILMLKNKELINLPTLAVRFREVGGTASLISSLLVDTENLGEAFIPQYLRILFSERAKRKIKDKFETIEDAPAKFLEEIKDIEQDFSLAEGETLADSMESFINQYEKYKTKYKTTGSVGIITGFNFIDENCPLVDGSLAIIAAKSSVGKTALALNMAVNAAFFDEHVIFFTAEMTKHEIITRALSQITNTHASLFKTGGADEALSKYKNDINKYGKNLKFVEAGAMTSIDICRVARQEAAHKKPAMIVIDYIQYLKDPLSSNQTNNDRIGNMTRAFKALALELKIPIIALSQVKRTTGIPSMSDLRDSGNIEQDADIVLILHRELRESTKANLIIAKNRNGAVIFDHVLNFEHKILTYTDNGEKLGEFDV